MSVIVDENHKERSEGGMALSLKRCPSAIGLLFNCLFVCLFSGVSISLYCLWPSMAGHWPGRPCKRHL